MRLLREFHLAVCEVELLRQEDLCTLPVARVTGLPCELEQVHVGEGTHQWLTTHSSGIRTSQRHHLLSRQLSFRVVETLNIPRVCHGCDVREVLELPIRPGSEGLLGEAQDVAQLTIT